MQDSDDKTVSEGEVEPQLNSEDDSATALTGFFNRRTSEKLINGVHYDTNTDYDPNLARRMRRCYRKS